MTRYGACALIGGTLLYGYILLNAPDLKGAPRPFPRKRAAPQQTIKQRLSGRCWRLYWHPDGFAQQVYEIVLARDGYYEATKGERKWYGSWTCEGDVLRLMESKTPNEARTWKHYALRLDGGLVGEVTEGGQFQTRVRIEATTLLGDKVKGGER